MIVSAQPFSPCARRKALPHPTSLQIPVPPVVEAPNLTEPSPAKSVPAGVAPSGDDLKRCRTVSVQRVEPAGGGDSEKAVPYPCKPGPAPPRIVVPLNVPAASEISDPDGLSPS